MTDAPPPSAPPPDADPRPARRLRLPAWTARAVFEAVLIVFSVVLALAANGWVEDRRTAARVEDMRGFLAAEIRQNRASLQSPELLPHHEDLKRKFGRAAGRQSDPVDEEATRIAMQTLFDTGLHPPELRDPVWTSVSQGDLIEHMAPEEVFALAEAYKAQREVEDWTDQAAAAAISLLDMLDDPRTAKLRLSQMTLLLEDVASRERRLVALYDRALARLGRKDSATARRGDAAPATG